MVLPIQLWDNYQSFKLQGFLGSQLLGIVPQVISVNRLKQLNLLLWRQFCSAQIIVNAAKYYTALYSRHWLTRMNDQANYSNSQEGSLQTCCLFMNEKLHAKRLFQSNLGFKLLPLPTRERIKSEKLAGFYFKRLELSRKCVQNQRLQSDTKVFSRDLYALLLI